MSESNTQLSAATPQPLDPSVAELIPFAHHNDWLALSDQERDRVKELLSMLSSVKTDPRGVTTALKAHAFANNGRRGWSFPNLRTIFYGWIAMNCDWRAVVRDYGHETSLPAAFIDHLRALVLKEHRSRKQAIEKVREAWREGEEVPGYGTWRTWFASRWPDRDVPRSFTSDYPEGWSDRNLYNYMPPPAQRKLATRGFAAAHGDIPHVIRDTSTLRPLEMIVFDDFECDTLAIHGRRVVRVRGGLALDVATRRRLAVGFKPLLTDDEGKKRAITRADVQILIGQIFKRYGVPHDYPVTLLVENAAAAIGEDLEAALDMFFHGQVTVQRTGMLEHRTLTNGFVENGGKPWEKGWIESAFNLMHNLAGSLPGQKGARYDLAPASTAARVLYCERLLDEKAGLTDDQIAQLRLPVESLDELITAYERIFDTMDRRTEHKLLGFDGLQEWTRGIGDTWHPLPELATLPSTEQLSVEIRVRKESPLERWQKLATRCKIVQVPEFIIALLSFTPKRVEVHNRKITFTHGGTGYTYLDVEGCLKALPEGRKLFGYFDENTPGCLYLTDLKGSRVGVLRHNAPADIKDPVAIGAAAALVREFFHKAVQGPVRELLAAEDNQLAVDRAHNELVVSHAALPEDVEKPRVALSATLANDKLTRSPAERFASATTAAAGIAASAEAQAEEARRSASPRRKPKHDLGALVADDSTADDASDLGKLL